MKAKKLVALLMAIVMVVGLLSMTASAAYFCSSCGSTCTVTGSPYNITNSGSFNVGPDSYMNANHQHVNRRATVPVRCTEYSGHTWQVTKSFSNVCPHNSSWYY